MSKIDLKKDLKVLFSPSAKIPSLVEVPPMNFLLVDGSGDPNKSQEFQEAVEVLFGASYTLKFMIKKELEVDYGVMPLEGLWWTEDMARFLADRDAWQWTAMIMQPEQVTLELLQRALLDLKKKKNPPALSKVKFSSFHEGRAAQIMHLGPFSAEGPTIAALHRFITEQGCQPGGKHHEIYLSDFRRTAPEKLRTILRQPVASVK